MSSIQHYQITTIHDLFAVLYEIANQKRTKIVLIIDSLVTLAAMIPDGIELFRYLSSVASVCRFIAVEKRAVVLSVNGVARAGNYGSADDQNINSRKLDFRPMLGKYWSNVPNTRLLIKHLREKTDEQREISVWESSNLEVRSKCWVKICEAGII